MSTVHVSLETTMKVQSTLDRDKRVGIEYNLFGFSCKQLCNANLASLRVKRGSDYVERYFKNVYNPLIAHFEFQTTTALE